jgi:hypothetical protein
MSELTISQRIDRAEAAVTCEKIMSRHCFYHSAGINREEYFEMWSKRPDITWAHGFGQMGDRWQYFQNYILGQESNTWQGFKNLWDVYPEVLDVIQETRRTMDYRAFNEAAMHLLTTPVIEVAEDGQSAQCLWYTPGIIYSTLNPQKEREGTWIWERYGADFIKEDGEWLYLNLRVCPDIFSPMDIASWTSPRPMGPPPDSEDGEDQPRQPEGPVMMLKIPGPLHRDYSVTQVPQDSPGIPHPHRTQDDIKLYSDVKTLED